MSALFEKVRHCLRCQHDWVKRKLIGEPKQCPACRSPYWSKPRKKRGKRKK